MLWSVAEGMVRSVPALSLLPHITVGIEGVETARGLELPKKDTGAVLFALMERGHPSTPQASSPAKTVVNFQ